MHMPRLGPSLWSIYQIYVTRKRQQYDDKIKKKRIKHTSHYCQKGNNPDVFRVSVG